MNNNCLLQVPESAKYTLRKLYNLDKPRRLDEAIDIIQNWIQKQDHIIKKDFSREFIEKTIIQCKGSVEKAKKQIDRLCTMKTLLPKYFKIINIREELGPILDKVYLVPLPMLTEDLYRVCLIKAGIQTLTSELILQFFQFSIMTCEYLKHHDYANGLIIVKDLRDTSVFDLVTNLNITELQQYITILVEGYGTRLKSIHLITESKTIEMLIKIMKQFVSEKIGKRMYVHATLEDLQTVLPKEIMPKEYGGPERSVWEMHEDWIDALNSNDHKEYLKMMFGAGVDESRRRNGKFNEEYMGMPGSFRNLSVD